MSWGMSRAARSVATGATRATGATVRGPLLHTRLRGFSFAFQLAVDPTKGDSLMKRFLSSCARLSRVGFSAGVLSLPYAALIAAACSGSVFAGTLSFNFAESGTTTTLTVSGSISDLSGWTYGGGVGANGATVQASTGYVASADTLGGIELYSRTPIAPLSIGSNSSIYSGNLISGDNVGFAANFGSNNYLSLPLGYSTGSPINSSSLFNQSLSSMGLTSGTTYSWNYGADTISINIAAVPEPSTCAMALAGLACGGYLVRRRRRAR